MKMKITIDDPEWSAVKHGKKVVMVEFPNCVSTKTGKSFKWVPRYDELVVLKKWLDKAEKQWEELKKERSTWE